MSRKSLRILLIDDDETIRRELEESLTADFGYHVDAAPDGKAGLDCLDAAGSAYDVALIDEALPPPIDGIEVMQQAKRQFPELECIVLTGWGSAERQRALQAGAFRFFEKPFDLDDLTTVIRAAAQQKGLRALGRALLAEHNLTPMLTRIIEAACDLAPADRAAVVFQLAPGANLRVFPQDVNVDSEWHRHFQSSSLTRDVLGSGQVVRISDTSQDARVDEALGKTGVRSFVGIPIPGTTGNQAVLYAYSFEPDHFDAQQTVAFLQSLASLAGQAIANAQAFEKIQTHAEYMEALVKAAQGFTRTTDISGLLALAWDFLREQLNVSISFIALYEYDTGDDTLSFPFAIENGRPLEIAPRVLGADMSTWGIAGYVVKQNQELFWETEQAAGVQCLSLGIQVFRSGGPRPLETMFFYPLSIGSRVLGVLSVQSYNRFAFSPILLDAVRTLGSQLAVALENTRLLEARQERERRLRTLYEYTETIQSSLKLEDALISACKTAVEFFGADHSGMVLFSSDLSEGVVAAEYPPDLGMLGSRVLVQGVPDEEGLAQGQQPLRIKDVSAADGLGPVRKLLMGFGIRSIMIVPVMRGDRVLGSFSLDAIRDKRDFTDDDVAFCQVLAAALGTAIENAQLYQGTEYRAELLSGLDEAARNLREERQTDKVYQAVVRLATRLLGCEMGFLWLNRPHLRELELVSVFGLPPERTPEFIGYRMSQAKGLAGLVARSGEGQIVVDYLAGSNHEWPFDEFNLKAAAGVPIQTAGFVEAVLVVAHRTAERSLTRVDLDVLDRFGAQAASALQAVRVAGREERTFTQLTILHRISDYTQTANRLEKILYAVLTGITASYGLRFNRAALFLKDEGGQALVGQVGMGQIEEYDAHRNWADFYRSGLDDFGHYLKRLEDDRPPETLLGQRIPGLLLPLASPAVASIMAEIAEGQCAILHADVISQLPGQFLEAFAPADPLVVVPLVARGRMIGLLVADNKFTRSPITRDDEELLLTFASSAALAIRNFQLLSETRDSEERLRSAFEASSALVRSQDPESTLRDIVQLAQRVAGAAGVAMMLIDDRDNVQQVIANGVAESPDFDQVVRGDGPSRWVVQTGEPVAVENAATTSLGINPRMFRDPIAAGLCLPLLFAGKPIGVVWFLYNQPHIFPQSDINALQLFVNQAAVAYRDTRRMRQISLLYQAAQAMAGREEPREVLTLIVHLARQVLQADSAAIWSYDQVRRMFIPDELVVDGMEDEDLLRFRKDEPSPGGTADTVMERGWVSVPDIAGPEIHSFLGSSTLHLLRSIGARSFQGVALRVGDERLGVLYINYRRPHAFDEDERQTLEAFATQAALALKQARLFAQLEQAREAAQLVARVTVETSLRDAMRTIVQSAQKVLRSDIVTLYAYNEQLEQFSEWVVVPDTVTSARSPSALQDTSVVWNILAMGDTPYYFAEDKADKNPWLGGYFVRQEGIRAVIGWRLRVRDRNVGVMFINYRTPHRFTADELLTIELFANQAAVAIHNAQVYDEAQRRGQALKSIQATAAGLSTILDPDSLLPLVTQEAAGALQADAASLMLWDETRTALMVGAIHGLSEEYREQRITKSHIDAVIEEMGDLHAYPTLDLQSTPFGRLDLIEHEDLRSALSAPLVVSDNLFGLLNVYSRGQTREFTAEEQELIEVFASHAASAIRNAQLYQEIEHRQGVLQVLHEAGGRITASLDRDTIMKEIVSQAQQLTAVHRKRASSSDIMLTDGFKLVFGHAEPEGSQETLRRIVGQGRKFTGDDDERIGITGRAAFTGKTQLVRDVRSDPDFYQAHEGETGSELAVPMVMGGRVVGVINMEHPEIGAFDEDDQRALEALAAQAALAIRNAQNHAVLQQRAGTLEALNRASQAITGTLTFQQTLDEIVKQALALTGARASDAFGHLALKSGNTLWFAAASDPGTLAGLQEVVGTLEVGDSPKSGITGRAAWTRRPQNVANVGSDPCYVCHSEQVCSELAVPIVIGDRVIGVLTIESPRPGQFPREDVEAMQSLATQAGVAIQSARRLQHAQLVAEISREAAQHLDLEAFLQTLFTRLKMVFEGQNIPTYLTWARYDKQKNALITQPTEFYPELVEPRVMGLDAKDIMTWVALSRHPYYTPDTRTDQLYFPVISEIRSELCVPVLFGSEVLGVLDIESSMPDAFDPEHQALVETLADHIAAAIDHVQQYEQLRKTKSLVGARTALAWMGMASSTWRHAIDKHAVTIRDLADLLRRDLRHDYAVSDDSKAAKRIAQIERLSEQILAKPITPPLSSEEGVSLVVINDFVRERAGGLWRNEPYNATSLSLDLRLPGGTTIRISTEWLRRAFDILVDNAIEAVAVSPVRHITIGTRTYGLDAEIAISDTGPGMPDSIKAKVGLEAIERPEDAVGMGMGLLMAHTILEAYGGALAVTESGPNGTTIVMRLPIIDELEQKDAS